MGADMWAASDLDRKRLSKECQNGGKVRCDLCDHADYNSGYDVPYCLKRTELGEGAGKCCHTGSTKPPYKLTGANIPRQCEYFLSEEIEDQKRARAERVRQGKSAVEFLTDMSPDERAEVNK